MLYAGNSQKISPLVFGVFLNSNQPDPTKPNHHPSSPSLTSTRPACQSNSHCKLQHHPVGGSHNAMVKIRFLLFGLLKWHFRSPSQLKLEMFLKPHKVLWLVEHPTFHSASGLCPAMDEHQQPSDIQQCKHKA